MDTTTRILLIDEAHSEYLVIGNLLAQVHHTDYELTWCEGGSSALEEVLSDNYDVVLFDYYCGDTSGRDLLTAAQSQGCRIPILVMTDEMEAEVDRTAIRAGASDYLIRGRIDSQLLERTIRYAIERKEAEIKLTRLAHYDQLTNIPNRILFRDRLEHAIQKADRDALPFTLMYLDMDGFKQVNDNYGHDAGDALIRAFADRLRCCMRRCDSVARIGGDEFTLLLEQTESTADIAHIAEKVLATVARPYQIGRHEVMVGCSMGIVVYPQTMGDADSLQKKADMAMYQAKQKDGSSYRFFTEAMHREAEQQLQLESELRQALCRNEFTLYYQPRVDLYSGDIVGIEALLRWDHPDRGTIKPSEFLATTEDIGLIAPLGYWVIHRACLDLKLMHQAGLPPLAMSLNLSLRQFSDDKLVTKVSAIFEDNGIRGDELEFEISESAVMENMGSVKQPMEQLSQLGVRFTLDDFGTASTSFMQLQSLPIDQLKIDRQFVARLRGRSGVQEREQKLVAAMINLAHNLDKRVIAEGVESEEQLQLLRQFGCDQAQGYFLGQPLTFTDLCRELQAEEVTI